MAKNLIVKYTSLLHRYRDLDAPKVRKFLEDNSSDSIFVRRVHALNEIFKLKEKIEKNTMDDDEQDLLGARKGFYRYKRGMKLFSQYFLHLWT